MEFPNIDDLIRRYLAGETIAELSRELGVCVHTVKAAFLARNVKIRGRAEAQRLVAKPTPDMGMVAELYVSGLTIKDIAHQLSVGHQWLWRRFKTAGIQVRSASEMTSALWNRPDYRAKNAIERRGRKTVRQKWWEGLSPERRRQIWSHRIAEALRGRTLSDEHRANVSAANRGRKNSDAHRAKNALAAERNPFKAEAYETAFVNALTSLGYFVTPQLAVGPYNLDVAFESLGVAVELDRGTRHFSARFRPSTAKRAEYLLDRGWSVLYVILGRNASPPGMMQKVLSFLKLASRDKPFHGQYGVVWCNEKYSTRPSTDLDGLPRVPGF